MGIEATDFKLIDKIVPAVAAGKYNFMATQTVKQEGTVVAEYQASQEYMIARRIFSLEAEGIFGTYPANGVAGDFAATLPFITFKDRSYPWAFGEQPFLALIVLTKNEVLSESQIMVSDLFAPVAETYFPDRKAFPSVYFDEETDMCRVVDIAVDTYREIFPSTADIPLLAHAKFADLSKSPDEVCAQDGYFSVIIANRFVPSHSGEETVSACHLVTAFGYGDDVPDGFRKVRLVSLHQWSVRSTSEAGRPFTELIAGLAADSSEIGHQKAGGAAAVKPHYTRTGEMTYSVFRSPLIPGSSTAIPKLRTAHTADGRLMYDQETGIFDVSYAAAFQLGRLITLSRPEIAAKILAHRNDVKMSDHVTAFKDLQNIDTGQIGRALLELEKADSARRKRKKDQTV